MFVRVWFPEHDTPHPTPLLQIIHFKVICKRLTDKFGSLLPASTITRFATYFLIIDQFTISDLIITVIIREAMRGMETIPPPGYFRSYIGKSVGS